MPNETNELSPPVNHVFVDYENVRDIDLTVIGSKTVHFTLLLGARQTKLDVALVEKLLLHAANVELIRLKSSGRNALDFALAYYLGRAVLADPCGFFHVVSKDTGYDALIDHLRGKHIRARRHDSFATLTFTAVVNSPIAIASSASPAKKTPVTPLVSKPPPAVLPVNSLVKPPKQSSRLDILEMRVLEHLRKPTTNRPRTRNKLVSHLTAHLGKHAIETDILQLVEKISQAGHLVSDDKGKLTYHLERL
jgi:hypothetical protein